MKELTSADVVEVTGVRLKELRGWCEAGYVEPLEGGEGQGSHRKFSVTQTVGIAVAVQLRRSERGCVLPFVGSVVKAFASVREEWMLAAFQKGKTHLVNIHCGKPLLRGKNYDWIDVQKTYHDVTQKIAEIEARFENFVGGRGRGLATAAKRDRELNC